MAATATQKVIEDGPRNLVLKYTIAGTTGDITDTVLVDASAFNDKNGDAVGANGFKLMAIQSALTGFSAKLSWDATTDVDLMTLPTDESLDFDFNYFGGITDNGAAGSTGDILITTTGYTASGDGGYILLYLKKK